MTLLNNILNLSSHSWPVHSCSFSFSPYSCVHCVFIELFLISLLVEQLSFPLGISRSCLCSSSILQLQINISPQVVPFCLYYLLESGKLCVQLCASESFLLLNGRLLMTHMSPHPFILSRNLNVPVFLCTMSSQVCLCQVGK